MRSAKHLTMEQILKIGRELNRTKSSTELAAELGINTSQIFFAAQRLRKKYGIDIPKANATSLDYDRAAELLKSEGK